MTRNELICSKRNNQLTCTIFQVFKIFCNDFMYLLFWSFHVECVLITCILSLQPGMQQYPTVSMPVSVPIHNPGYMVQSPISSLAQNASISSTTGLLQPHAVGTNVSPRPNSTGLPLSHLLLFFFQQFYMIIVLIFIESNCKIED